MDQEDIDFSRGDDDIVFIQTDRDMEDISEAEDPEERLKKEMSLEGLEWENCQLLGLFQNEFSLMMKNDAEIRFEGEEVGPKDLQGKRKQS